MGGYMREVYLVNPLLQKECFELKNCSNQEELAEALKKGVKCGVSISWRESRQYSPLPFPLLQKLDLPPYATRFIERVPIPLISIGRSIPPKNASVNDVLVVLLELEKPEELEMLCAASLPEIERLCLTYDTA